MTHTAVPEGHAVHPEQGGGGGQEVLHLQPQVCHQQWGDNGKEATVNRALDGSTYPG
jgi:hypothetical protein